MRVRDGEIEATSGSGLGRIRWREERVGVGVGWGRQDTDEKELLLKGEQQPLQKVEQRRLLNG